MIGAQFRMPNVKTDDLYHFILSDKIEWRHYSTARAQRVRPCLHITLWELRIERLTIRRVRFLDNFSAGTRGSASAEHFLRQGYAVIFLHRHFSLQPFHRHYSHSSFLDLLEIVPENNGCEDAVLGSIAGAEAKAGNGGGMADGGVPKSEEGMLFPPFVPDTTERSTTSPPSHSIGIPTSELPPMLSILGSYQRVQSLGLLHSISYVTVDEYLWLLRGVSRVMGAAKDAQGHALGKRGMYYLAAAVSDFFIPTTRMVSPRPHPLREYY